MRFVARVALERPVAKSPLAAAASKQRYADSFARANRAHTQHLFSIFGCLRCFFSTFPSEHYRRTRDAPSYHLGSQSNINVTVRLPEIYGGEGDDGFGFINCHACHGD